MSGKEQLVLSRREQKKQIVTVNTIAGSANQYVSMPGSKWYAKDASTKWWAVLRSSVW